MLKTKIILRVVPLIATAAFLGTAWAVASGSCVVPWSEALEKNKSFAKAVDVFRNNVPLVSLVCNRRGVEIAVGGAQADYYIWHKAYPTRDGNTFSPEDAITLSGDKTVAGQWLVGTADGTLPSSFLDSGINYLAVYICQYRNGDWRCGCRTQNDCAEPGKGKFVWNVIGFDGTKKNLSEAGDSRPDRSVLSPAQREFIKSDQSKIFTRAEVAEHNKPNDCWIILDGFVFDMSSVAELHPTVFTCGGDGTEKYHKNHGPVIRDRMDEHIIGELAPGEWAPGGDSSGSKENVSSDISPQTELFVQPGSWDPRDLMIVMERENRSLLFIDGASHTPVARIKDIGSRVHTQVFSPDGNYVFHISRDGWLTKIDLRTLQSVAHNRIGLVSRGTAMTADGRYVAVGNYEPRELVIVDTQTLQPVKKIPLVGTEGGKIVESRAGAVVEHGTQVIVALKDTADVWVVETAREGMPVTKFSVGGENEELHDGFLTPDGRYFIVAMFNGNTVWVLDMQTMKPVTKVPTGKKPHTGPGASYKNLVFVPAMEEGAITVIDTLTWQRRATIRTGGGALFIRSNAADPNYRYVWTETAFGDRKDEIYVIDAEELKIIKTLIPVPGKKSLHPEFTRNGKFVYVAVWEADEVVVYDADTFELVKRIPAVTPSGISNVGLRLEEPGI